MRVRGRRWHRHLGRRLVGGALAVVVGYVAFTGGQVWWMSRRNDARPAQAILTMGAAEYNGRPSPVLVARLSHALRLWQRRLAPLIVAMGGKEKGDVYTESEVSAAWLERHGVPASSIVQVGGRDSWESLSAAADYLGARRLTGVLLVSDPYHEERIAQMAARLGLRPYPSPTRTSPIRGWAVAPYMARETVAVSLGRILGYRWLSRVMHG